MDLRKMEPCAAYGSASFDVPVGQRGDVLDSYLVRVKEMENALKIIEQALAAMGEGPVMAEKVPKKLKPPKGDIYHCVETPRGELGIYIVSDETDTPYRMKWRVPSFSNLMIFPEENRAILDVEACGYRDIPTVAAYNCTNTIKVNAPVATAERNGRVLYQGTISQERTFADYYLDPRARHLPIDLYGRIEGPEADRLTEAFADLGGSVRYLGFVDGGELARLRRHYAFSLVSWNPVNQNQYYACPNKFFESVADGVPPITAPHPQPKMLVERYGCGMVMDDWSFDAFLRAVVDAVEAYGTARYESMVRGCQEAIVSELNWECQFGKVARHLP